jgi:hypothetical protein
MTVSLSPDVAQELWDAALEDSGIPPAEVHRFDALPPENEGAGAQWWAPGLSVDTATLTGLKLSKQDARDANRAPLIDKHRVAIAPILGLAADLTEAVFAGKARHELEHARQWNSCGVEPFSLMNLAIQVCARKTGGSVHGSFLGQLPIEDDANSAAAVFVRHVRPSAVEELVRHGAYASLARAVIGPCPHESLVTRMTAFLFHYRPIIESMAASLPTERYLEMWAPSAVDTWTALCARTP